MKVPQKIKNGTALSPNDSTSGNTTEEIQNTNSKEDMHPYVHCSMIYNSHTKEATQVRINRQEDKKMWYICTREYYSATEKNEILQFATAWMDLKGIMLSEISQSDRTNTI